MLDKPKKRLSQLSQFQARVIVLKPDEVWQISGSFVKVEYDDKGTCVLKVVRDIRDQVKRRQDVEITEQDFDLLDRIS